MAPHERKLNRLKGYDYCQSGCYFVTICVQNHECVLGNVINGKMQLSRIGEMANNYWRKIPAHFPNTELNEFVIMPNHVHGIIVIDNVVGNKNICSQLGKNNNDEKNNNYCSLQVWQTKWGKSLSSIVRGFKIGVIKWCRQNNHEDFTWQKSYYDHIVRNEESLHNIQEYIVNNPEKWEIDKNNPGNLWM